jgi:hypothetical protein
LLSTVNQALLRRRNTFLFFYTFFDTRDFVIGFNIDFNLKRCFFLEIALTCSKLSFSIPLYQSVSIFNHKIKFKCYLMNSTLQVIFAWPYLYFNEHSIYKLYCIWECEEKREKLSCTSIFQARLSTNSRSQIRHLTCQCIVLSRTDGCIY